MSERPTAIDQSWSRVSPADAKRNGIVLVCDYLSHDASKDWTAADIRAYHEAGVGCWLNWESEAGRPLLGYSAGYADGQAAAMKVEALIHAVGYTPGNRLVIPFSCDTDATPAQYATCADYYRGAHDGMAGRYGVGAYGHADLIDYLTAHGNIEAAWQTYAWSGGRLSANADLYQFLNGQTLAGASVDFNRIVHPDRLGAWWPPGHAVAVASNGAALITTTKETDEVTPDDIKAIASAVWARRFDGEGFAAPASLVVANTLKVATQAATNDVMGKPLSRAGVGPAPREVWLGDARNLAAAAKDEAIKATAKATEAADAASALSAKLDKVLAAVEHLTTYVPAVASSAASGPSAHDTVAALGAAITKGVQS